MIRENLADGVLDHEEKLCAGLVYAETVVNPGLTEELRKLGAKPMPDSPVQVLARAISPSPAEVDESAMESSRGIAPAGIVELVSFVSVLQLLHRLQGYYGTTGV